MIKAFVKNRAVRIVHPLRGRRDVENGPGGIGLGARHGGLDGGSRAGNGFVRGFSPRDQRQEEKNENTRFKGSQHKKTSGLAARDVAGRENNLQLPTPTVIPFRMFM